MEHIQRMKRKDHIDFKLSGLTIEDVITNSKVDSVIDYLSIKSKNNRLKQKDVCRHIGITPYKLNENLNDNIR